MFETPETSPPLQQRRSMNVSEWPVVRKVALVLAVPFLLAVLLGALRVQSDLSEASAATSAASQVTVLGPSVAYLSAAEDAAIVFRATDNEQQRTTALKAVNAEAADLESAWSQADLSDDQRQQVRALLDTTQGLRDGSAYTIVSTAVDQLARLEAEVTLGIAGMTDGGARTEQLINLVGQLNKGRLAVTESQLLVVQRPSVIPKNDLYGLFGAEDAVIDNLELLLPDDAAVAVLRQYNSSNTGLLGIGTPELKGEQPLAKYDELSVALQGQIEDRLSSAAAASNRTALLTALLTGLALLIAIGLAVTVSRALVRPIQLVRDGALTVARETLPETVRRIRAGREPGEFEPIPVTTHEELGQLARAVDDLHGTAVRLAQDESELRSRVGEMFVTLSRRNTSLVNQQLHLIERLESDEEDPQRLESLFRLDHLATRMRRTAESLVILADAPTQHSEQATLSVDEALHAATAGVRDYPRVELSGAPSQRIIGTAAPDVVHLFTELIDNALSFSPPTAPVRVTTSTPAGMVLVEVEDAGLGIDNETLLDLNTTLRTGAEITADAARRMGLFVVARLARRHGLTVTLERNAEGGTTARVFLPKPLLQADAPDTAPETLDGLEALTAEEPAQDEHSWFEDLVEEPVSEPVEEPVSESPTEAADEPAALWETEGGAGDWALEELEELAAKWDVDAPDEPADEEPDVQEPASEEFAEDVEDVADVAEPAVAEQAAEQAAEPVAEDPGFEPEPEPVPVASEQPLLPAAFANGTRAAGLDALAAVINANIRLPQRDPGTAPQPTPLTSLLRQRLQATQPAAVATEIPEAPVNGKPAIPLGPVTRATETPEAEVEVPETLAADTPAADTPAVDTLAAVMDFPERAVAEATEATEEATESEVAEVEVAEAELTDPEVQEPVAGPVDPLADDASAYVADEHGDDETPMFRLLRSSWFTSEESGWKSGAAEAGWRAADRADDCAPSRLTQSGLPVRDPGNRLVPGGVTQPAAALRRDPEAIRARLSAHVAGVNRGRNTKAKTAKLDPPTPATENAEDVTG